MIFGYLEMLPNGIRTSCIATSRYSNILQCHLIVFEYPHPSHPMHPVPPLPARGGLGGLGIRISFDFALYFIVFKTPFKNTLLSFLDGSCIYDCEGYSF